MNLFLIDKHENVIGVIPDSKIIDLTQSLEINQADVLNGTITLDKSLNLDDVRYFAVPDRDNKHNLWLYRKTTVKLENDDIIIQGVNAFYDDLKAYGYIKDKRPNSINAADAVRLILANTRWNIDFVDSELTSSQAELHDTSFYYLTYLDAIKSIEDTWTVEIQPFINIEGNKITRKYVNLYKQMGSNRGKRFVYGKSALQIVKESDDTDVYTALIGRGAGIAEQDENGNDTGGYSRKITFADVEWSQAKGDPVDKPKGQEWVEWSQATKEFGYSDGTPRFGIVEFQNEEDPTNLLKETWKSLQKSAIPAVQFSATVGDVGFLSLGETVAIVRYDLDIKYQTRVIKIEWNRKNEQASQITLGDKLVQTAADRYRSVQSEAYKARDIADQATSQANFAIDNAGTTVEWGSNEPTNPKEGTIWYDRQLDGTVVMKKYEDGQWIILIDDTTGKQIENKVDKAEKDVNQLKLDTTSAQAEINNKLTANDKKLSDFNNDLLKNETKVDSLNTQILNVDKKTDDIKNSADSAITIANDAKNGLLTKVDSNEFHSSIQQVDNAIQTKVNSSDFNSKVTQLDSSIQSKVSSDTFYSQITQLSNGISSTVSKIDNLQIGGRNLLHHTGDLQDWQVYNFAGIEGNLDLMYKGLVSYWARGTWAAMCEDVTDNLIIGHQYTASAWIKGDKESDCQLNWFSPYQTIAITHHITNDWQRYHVTFTATGPDTTYGWRTDIEAADMGNLEQFNVCGMKLEEGNIATDWTPNPDDMAKQSQITQLDNEIQTKVSNADYESKVTQLANGIQSNVTAINNIKVGGTNLLTGTKSFANTWNNNNAGIEGNHDNWYKDFTTTWALGAYGSVCFSVIEDWLEAGKTYTVSAWLRTSESGSTKCDIRFYSPRSWAQLTDNISTQWHRYSATFVASDNVNPNGLRADIEQSYDNGGALYVAGIKVEEGNVATDWSPAPIDLATQSQITQLSDSINTKVSNADFISKTTQLADGLSANVTDTKNAWGTINRNSGNISVLSNNINLKVSKNDVVNQINISTEGILIDGKRTHITGQTVIDNAVIKNGMIDTMSASKLTAGTIDANAINVINLRGNNIVSGSITADKIAAGHILVGLDNSLANLQLTPTSLVMRDDNNQAVFIMNKTGMRVNDAENNEQVGWIHANRMVDNHYFNGLMMDVDASGDYIGWGSHSDNNSNYEIKMAYYKNGYTGVDPDTLVIEPRLQLVSGDIRHNGATLEMRNSMLDGKYNLPTLGRGRSFIMFGDTDVFVVINGSRYSMNDVIHSIGTGSTWN
ncbi:phage tail spike protein [Fructilactobacillus sp. Tb1]|uniref:phage tail spike protein n=1 Tax=Fructilactobacillus sp. Tb1 TaxID=3422304 RepID=UPI003D2DE0F6